MSESLGCLCIVLHGHLPFVLHHGAYPHGEAWLYEGAAETYLPLLDVIQDVVVHKMRPALTVGLTPVLLEQLSHDDFKNGFVRYLNERIERAAHDRAEFEQKRDTELAELAERWGKFYAARLAHFERIGRDIPAEFARHLRDGHIQVLTSTATHAYMPLLLNDPMLRAQMACGTSASRKRLGAASFRGMWLPECAYRPASTHWMPAALYGDARPRAGIEQFIAGAGVDHFFVDSHLVGRAETLGSWEGGHFKEVSEPQIHWDRARGWGDPLQPVGVASQPGPPACVALARHPRVSEQVWSSIIGYPGSGEYLEFHRKHGEGGLRYHRVTHHQVPLHEKRPYDPALTHGKLYEHSRHFCSVVRTVLQEFKTRTNGRPGVCVAPFDAELFGHWWHEGPLFLQNVIFTLSRDPQIELLTAEQALERYGCDKVVRLPEGSWGQNGNHSVWQNDRTKWMWEMEYRAENRMLKLLHVLPWRTDGRVRGMLERAGRELLLLQASDWPFVIHSGGAVDYGITRFGGHCTRFDRVATTAEALARDAGREMTALERVQVEEVDLHDTVFPAIDLNWWT